MTQKTGSLAAGISILGLAGIICKVVGVLYRIPLANVIEGEGSGLYSLVFPTYNLMLTVSSAGIPVAISRLVSHHLAEDDPRNARRVFLSSLRLLIILGALATALMALLSGALSSMVGRAETKIGFLAIAPSLLIVCVMSAFRGYMQGRRHMSPTAFSQLIEQVGKVFIALPFASLGMQRAGYAGGAAGALLGTSVAEAAALCYMALCTLRRRGEMAKLPQNPDKRPLSMRYLTSYIIRVSVPITIGACIVPLAGMIDSAMLVNIMTGYGLDASEATIRYGLLSNLVLPLINVPTAIAMAMAVNLVPAISASLSKGDRRAVARDSQSGLRMASLISIPCSVGMAMLAKPILYCLYSAKYTPEQLDMAASMLSVSAYTIALFTQVQATSGILQGLRRQKIPMYTLAAGVVCKVALNYTLVRNPAVSIFGAPFASLLCYTVSMLPNLYYVKKYSCASLSLRELLLRPGVAALGMAAAVRACVLLIGENAVSRSYALLFAVIMVAVLVYFALAIWLGAIKREDMPRRLRFLVPKFIPKHRR